MNGRDSRSAGALVDARGLFKSFRAVTALGGVDLLIERGDFVAVMGPSGSGKSTLLHIIGCLDRPTSGSYRFSGRDVSALSDVEVSRIRARRIGFVFQMCHLIPQLTVLENVEVPFAYRGDGERGRRAAALRAIEQVGLIHRIGHRPAELSGGELQRTAIARAVAGEPALILADEPTGNLDSSTGRQIMELIASLHRKGAAVLLVTHDEAVAGYARRRLRLSDGRFV
jgi:putative ABC transport system ATP-binding protein